MKLLTVSEIQAISLDIVKDIHQYCIANHITYTLYGGSLLGAIRHNGFIPWDDDIDIAMPRPDYERFIHTFSSSKGYKVFSRELNDGAGVYISYSRVCEFSRTIVKQKTVWTDEQTGIWVDVFPLDPVEEEIVDCVKRLSRIKREAKKGIFLRLSFTPLSSCKRFKSFVKVLFSKFYSLFFPVSPYDKITYIAKSLKWGKTNYFANVVFTAYGIRERHNIRVLNSFVLHPFEDTSLYIMSGYDEALREKYGDYMTLPPLNKRLAKHDSYAVYWV